MINLNAAVTCTSILVRDLCRPHQPCTHFGRTVFERHVNSSHPLVKSSSQIGRNSNQLTAGSMMNSFQGQKFGENQISRIDSPEMILRESILILPNSLDLLPSKCY